MALLFGRQAVMGCGAAFGGPDFGDVLLVLNDWPRHSTARYPDKDPGPVGGPRLMVLPRLGRISFALLLQPFDLAHELVGEPSSQFYWLRPRRKTLAQRF